MTASHLDTVPNGGAFDGVLGVLAAVEAIRILREEGFEPARPIWVGSFMDEEGTRFGTALFGSRAFCGVDVSEALEARDAEGVSVAEAMAARGLDPARVGEAERVGEVGSYVELHIEQGPVLDTHGERLGVVESICGVLGLRVRAARRDQPRRVDAARDAARRARRRVAGRGRAARGDAAAQRPARDRRSDPRRARRAQRDPGAVRVHRRPAARRAGDLRRAAGVVRRAGRADRGAEERLEADDPLRLRARADRHGPRRDQRDRGGVARGGRRALPDGLAAPATTRCWSAGGRRRGCCSCRRATGISHSPSEWTETADCELGARVLARTMRRLASAT